jgi:hypothetical protein
VQLEDEYKASEMLIISTNYAMSSKEKVASNGLRAMGYYLMNADLQRLSN